MVLKYEQHNEIIPTDSLTTCATQLMKRKVIESNYKDNVLTECVIKYYKSQAIKLRPTKETFLII